MNFNHRNRSLESGHSRNENAQNTGGFRNSLLEVNGLELKSPNAYDSDFLKTQSDIEIFNQKSEISTHNMNDFVDIQDQRQNNKIQQMLLMEKLENAEYEKRQNQRSVSVGFEFKGLNQSYDKPPKSFKNSTKSNSIKEMKEQDLSNYLQIPSNLIDLYCPDDFSNFI